MKRIVPVLLALASPALALAQTTTWNIDGAHTQSTFAVRHMVISTVRGEFQKTSGVVKLDEGDLARSSVEATIDVASLRTREEKRDAHLRSPDFFDAQKYPTITFKSSKVEKAGDRYRVAGDLTLHGVTKPVVLDAAISPEVKDPWGMTRRGIQASTKIDRQDFGLRWNQAVEAGPVVGDEVTIEIDAEIVKQAAEQKAAAGEKAVPTKKAAAKK